MATGAGDVGKATVVTTLLPESAENVAAETGI